MIYVPSKHSFGYMVAVELHFLNEVMHFNQLNHTTNHINVYLIENGTDITNIAQIAAIISITKFDCNFECNGLIVTFLIGN